MLSCAFYIYIYIWRFLNILFIVYRGDSLTLGVYYIAFEFFEWFAKRVYENRQGRVLGG